MSRVTCAEVSAFYESEHAQRGVRILKNAKVEALVGNPRTQRVEAVQIEGGETIPTDVVVVGVGVTADDDLAAAAGLVCDNGIVVDEYCRTSDSAIFAAGDCTHHPNLHYGRRVRQRGLGAQVISEWLATRSVTARFRHRTP